MNQAPLDGPKWIAPQEIAEWLVASGTGSVDGRPSDNDPIDDDLSHDHACANDSRHDVADNQEARTTALAADLSAWLAAFCQRDDLKALLPEPVWSGLQLVILSGGAMMTREMVEIYCGERERPFPDDWAETFLPQRAVPVFEEAVDFGFEVLPENGAGPHAVPASERDDDSLAQGMVPLPEPVPDVIAAEATEPAPAREPSEADILLDDGQLPLIPQPKGDLPKVRGKKSLFRRRTAAMIAGTADPALLDHTADGVPPEGSGTEGLSESVLEDGGAGEGQRVSGPNPNGDPTVLAALRKPRVFAHVSVAVILAIAVTTVAVVHLEADARDEAATAGPAFDQGGLTPELAPVETDEVLASGEAVTAESVVLHDGAPSMDLLAEASGASAWAAEPALADPSAAATLTVPAPPLSVHRGSQVRQMAQVSGREEAPQVSLLVRTDKGADGEAIKTNPTLLELQEAAQGKLAAPAEATEPAPTPQRRPDSLLLAAPVTTEMLANPSLLRSALAQGADPNRNMVEDGRNPLLAAAASRQVTALETLLAHGADPNARSPEGGSALMSAAWSGDLKMAQALVGAGADLGLRNRDRKNALMAAASQGHTDIVDLLLRHRAPVNDASITGWTPLMYAVWGRHTDTVRLLLSHDADRKRRNGAGDTAGDIAEDRGYRVLAAILGRESSAAPKSASARQK